MLKEELRMIENIFYLLSCRNKKTNEFKITSKRKQKAID